MTMSKRSSLCLQFSVLFLKQRRYSAHITCKNEYMKESPWLRCSYKLPVKADVSLQFGPKPANKTYKNKQIEQRNNQAKRKEDANISPVFFLVLNLQLLPEVPILLTVRLNRSEIITFKTLYLPKFSFMTLYLQFSLTISNLLSFLSSMSILVQSSVVCFTECLSNLFFPILSHSCHCWTNTNHFTFVSS